MRPLALVAGGGRATGRDHALGTFWTTEDAVTERNYDATPGDFIRPDVGVNKTYMVVPIEALSNHPTPARRLLDVVRTWPDAPDGVATVVSEGAPIRTAKQLRPDEVDQLVDGWKQGKKVGELAKEFGVHRAAVGRHLASRGIETQPPALSTAQVQEVVELYEAGWSSMRIAKRYGVSDATVRSRLAEAGVRMRAAGRPRSARPATALVERTDSTSGTPLRDSVGPSAYDRA